MDPQKLHGIMVDGSSTRTDLKNAIQQIRVKLQQDDVTSEQVKMMARGLYHRFDCDYDVVRQETLECCKDNVTIILKFCPAELFFAIQKCLWTQNRSYDAIIHSESSRFTLLTLLLKFLIHLQKRIEEEKAKAVEYLTQYQGSIKQMLIKQFPDNCPENRQQVCKCIYRMSIAYKHLLTDDDIEELSGVIVKNFNHQRHQVRELSLHAFVQLHLCDKSKCLREHFPPILNFLLSNDDSKEMLLDASKTLLSQHIDRHVFAPMISVAFMANLQDKDFYDAFTQLGEQYIKENAKYDKFLQIQCEMQSTSQATAEFFASMNTLIQQFSGCAHFKEQMNGGCRTIAYLCLNNNVEVLVQEAVSLKTDIILRKKLIRLITNLILINQWNIRKFGQVFTSKLAELSQSPDFQQLCGIVVRFLPFEQVQKYLADKVVKGFRDSSLSIPAMKALCLFTQTVVNISLEDIQNVKLGDKEGDKVVGAIGETQLSGNYKDELQDLYYERINKNNLVEILKTFFSENGQNFIEDSDFIASFDNLLKCLASLPSEIVGQKDILAKVVCGMAAVVRHYEQIAVLTNEQKSRLEKSHDIYSKFCCQYLDDSSLAAIDMKLDVSQLREQLPRTQILATILKLTTESGFPQRAKVPLLTVTLKLLKTAQDEAKSAEKTRLASLQCVGLIVRDLPLTPAEESLLISGLLKASAWKVIARAPLCLVEAFKCLKLLLEASIKKGHQETKNGPLTHFPTLINSVKNQMEEDDFICRRAALDLCEKVIEYAILYNWDDFGEMQFALVQRLNDAKTINSIDGLELFVKLTYQMKRIKEQRYNITDLLITHINDSVPEIRKKSFWALKKVAQYLDKDIVTEMMEGKNFEFFDMNEVLVLVPEADGSWAQEKAQRQNQPKPEHVETNVLSAIGLDPLEKDKDKEGDQN